MSDVTTLPNGALLNFIERASRDDNFDVAKFGELLRLQRDVAHDQSRRAFNEAMSACQSEMLPVIRDAKNSHIGNRYARLETIDTAMRPIYTRHGFSVRYGSAPAPDGIVRITCTVAHSGGYFEENYLEAPLATTGSQGGRNATTPVQAVGSTVTYLRRYLLGMVFNIVLADDDDDGEASRRVAAASVTRATRVYDTAGATAGQPAGRTDAQWRTWLDKLRGACELLNARSEVVELASRDTVGDAIKDGPAWVQREISAILAENYSRFPEPAETAAEAPA